MATNPFSEFLSGVKKLWFVSTGAAADNATASGNPVLVGGRYSATPATRHDGDVATIETDSQGRVLTVVSGSNAPRASQLIILANAVAITDITAHTYNICTVSGLTADQIRQFTDFKISIIDTHTNASLNATANVTIYSSNAAGNIGDILSSGIIYNEVAILPNGSTSMIFSSIAGGMGTDAKYKTVPALKGVHSNLFVQIAFTNAPTSGALTIKVEGVK